MAMMAAMLRPRSPRCAVRRASTTAGSEGHGPGQGSVTLGGRRVPVDRPGARTIDRHEVPLTSYLHFAADNKPPTLSHRRAG
jgi:hypothetical protein